MRKSDQRHCRVTTPFPYQQSAKQMWLHCDKGRKKAPSPVSPQTLQFAGNPCLHFSKKIIAQCFLSILTKISDYKSIILQQYCLKINKNNWCIFDPDVRSFPCTMDLLDFTGLHVDHEYLPFFLYPSTDTFLQAESRGHMVSLSHTQSTEGR